MPLFGTIDPLNKDAKVVINPRYTEAAAELEVPKFRIPEHPMDPQLAFRTVHDELMLDGNARLNLATFVTTWMPPLARLLMAETADKNMIDKDEYPQTAELERRCVNIIADLWSSPDAEEAIGCSTTGSSEAAMLCGLALKWRWRKAREQEGKPADKPNMVMGINVQVCWDKFCRYFDVEPRFVPLDGDRLHMTAPEAVKLCDENTIGVVAIMGSTFDGSYEPVAEIAQALDQLEKDKGLDIPIHVDAASGGFVAPFIQPEIEWDFRVPRVQSINASGHKYGLVYPGVGWAIWREKAALPQELIFDVNYLGGHMPTFALNFSRPGSQVVLQYYTFLAHGREGITSIQRDSHEIAMRLAEKISTIGPFELVSDGSELPVFAFKLKDEIDNYTVFDVSERVRDRGWLLPAYSMPKNREDLDVLRVVVRNGFSRDLADLLVDDLKRHCDYLSQLTAPLPGSGRQSFHH